MSEKIPVSTTSTDHYNITIGSELLSKAAQFLKENFGSRKLIIVIDENVYRLHGGRIKAAFSGIFDELLTIAVPEGEGSKSIEQFNSIVDQVLKSGAERKTPLLAIGGGVVGDLAGYVAATVLRGIPLIHIPTTLLAMVDSSIGGKTGINHSTGKNLIGAFYQPKAVFTDVSFLETLPHKEWVNGLSEIIKYGMIESPEILDQLDTLISDQEFKAPSEWIPVISKSAQIKTDIVNKDVKESGVREFLNFGHTFAHVIENKGEYGTYAHGEAVFAGMYGAVYASKKLGADVEVEALDKFRSLYSFSLDGISDSPSAFTHMMLRDKKTKDNTVRLVLLNGPGDPVVRSFEDTAIVDDSWDYIFKLFN